MTMTSLYDVLTTGKLPSGEPSPVNVFGLTGLTAPVGAFAETTGGISAGLGNFAKNIQPSITSAVKWIATGAGIGGGAYIVGTGFQKLAGSFSGAAGTLEELTQPTAVTQMSKQIQATQAQKDLTDSQSALVNAQSQRELQNYQYQQRLGGLLGQDYSIYGQLPANQQAQSNVAPATASEPQGILGTGMSFPQLLILGGIGIVAIYFLTKRSSTPAVRTVY